MDENIRLIFVLGKILNTKRGRHAFYVVLDFLGAKDLLLQLVDALLQILQAHAVGPGVHGRRRCAVTARGADGLRG